MKSVFFNELTLDDSPSQNVMLLKSFQKVWSHFCKASDGIGKRLLIEEKSLSILMQALTDPEVTRDTELVQFVTTVLNKPYNTTDQSWPEKIRDQFLGSEFTVEIPPAGSEECRTLGWAHLNASVTLGFDSSRAWNLLVHRITETSLDGTSRQFDVLCVTKLSHLTDRGLQSWVACQRDFEDAPLPPKCDIESSQKKIHYRDDHGREILEAFGRKLLKNDYVVEVVNSLPWRPGCDHFILDVRDDGIVYICLHWHDEGYGLAVRTTARGILQTRKVAELLEEEYDQRT